MPKKLEKFSLHKAQKDKAVKPPTKYDVVFTECNKNLGYWLKFERGSDFNNNFHIPASEKAVYSGIKLATVRNGKPGRGISVRNLTSDSFEAVLTAKRIKVGPGQSLSKAEAVDPSQPTTSDELAQSDIQVNSVW